MKDSTHRGRWQKFLSLFKDQPVEEIDRLAKCIVAETGKQTDHNRHQDHDGVFTQMQTPGQPCQPTGNAASKCSNFQHVQLSVQHFNI